ncbi:AraC family transcriptional regulator [Roseibium sp. SCP14]|uniref:AraC family transcriptional regulator n=1 Tax=Roseibium sp. SCP14 TaxID=3141375 RepID=UPI003338B3FD
MISKGLISDVVNYVRNTDQLDFTCETGVDGLYAFCSEQTTEFEATCYEPFLGLILQGAKEAHLGDQVIHYPAGASLVVSHAVPVKIRVTVASPKEPYVALAIRVDLSIARSLIDLVGSALRTERVSLSISTAEGDAALTDAMARLFRLSHNPVEAQALAPLVMKEVHFRLLRAQHGSMLRQLLLHESPANRLSKAISIIRSDYKAPISVAELAAAAGMSPSTFHEHFKSLTSTTPLQYQKELRLLEARRLLMNEGNSVASVAYDVGYESPTQFSREYTRKFSVPPSKDRDSYAVPTNLNG